MSLLRVEPCSGKVSWLVSFESSLDLERCSSLEQASALTYFWNRRDHSESQLLLSNGATMLVHGNLWALLYSPGF